LTKIAKESGGEALMEWIKPCTNHLFWSATTTLGGNGLVIWAKFKTFLSHVINKHDKLQEDIFNKCAHHEDIKDSKWLNEGMYIFVYTHYQYYL
jgi:hypothetical protein